MATSFWIPPQAVPFVDRKAVDAVRLALLSQLGLPRTYDLDRLDLAVRTTLDGAVRLSRAADFDGPLRHRPCRGLIGDHICWAAPIRTTVVHAASCWPARPARRTSCEMLTVQRTAADQSRDAARARIDGPPLILRDVLTAVMTALHARYGGMTRDALRSASIDPKDGLSRWAVDYLSGATDRSLPSMLDAAMTRRYSASPSEAFFTGGGVHHFANYEREDNGRVLTVREAFRRSVNLVFIRLMRDLVHYFAFGPDGVNSSVLRDEANPLRRQYLNRFADKEGQTFLRR